MGDSEDEGGAGGWPPPPPPLPRTNRTSLVPPLVLSGHAASLTRWPVRGHGSPAPVRWGGEAARRRGAPDGAHGALPMQPWRGAARERHARSSSSSDEDAVGPRPSVASNGSSGLSNGSSDVQPAPPLPQGGAEPLAGGGRGGQATPPPPHPNPAPLKQLSKAADTPARDTAARRRARGSALAPLVGAGTRRTGGGWAAEARAEARAGPRRRPAAQRTRGPPRGASPPHSAARHRSRRARLAAPAPRLFVFVCVCLCCGPFRTAFSSSPQLPGGSARACPLPFPPY